jgi:hypothetical protein
MLTFADMITVVSPRMGEPDRRISSSSSRGRLVLQRCDAALPALKNFIQHDRYSKMVI